MKRLPLILVLLTALSLRAELGGVGPMNGRTTPRAETDPIFGAWLTNSPTINGNFIGNGAGLTNLPVAVTNGSSVFNGTFVGNGAGLTNLPSSGASTTPVAIGSIGGSNVLNFTVGAYQSALVTNALTLLPPTNGTHGARLEVWLKADGGGQTLNFDAAIVRPSDSGATYPKTLGTNLTYIVLLRNSSNIWWLTSLVGGW